MVLGSVLVSRALVGTALACLVVAAGAPTALGSAETPSRLTLSVFPTTLDWNALATFRGALNGAGTGELVEVEAKECGVHPPSFRAITAGGTNALGTWEANSYLERNAVVRAVWKDQRSVEISVKQRVAVGLVRLRSGLWLVSITAGNQHWHKRVTIQVRRGGKWRLLRSVLLTETGANDPTGQRSAVWSSTEVRLRVSRGSLLRAVFPSSQVGQCNAPGVGRTVRA